MLVGGIKPHLYCLPILKAEIHRKVSTNTCPMAVSLVLRTRFVCVCIKVFFSYCYPTFGDSYPSTIQALIGAATSGNPKFFLGTDR